MLNHGKRRRLELAGLEYQNPGIGVRTEEGFLDINAESNLPVLHTAVRTDRNPLNVFRGHHRDHRGLREPDAGNRALKAEHHLKVICPGTGLIMHLDHHVVLFPAVQEAVAIARVLETHLSRQIGRHGWPVLLLGGHGKGILTGVGLARLINHGELKGEFSLAVIEPVQRTDDHEGVLVALRRDVDNLYRPWCPWALMDAALILQEAAFISETLLRRTPIPASS